MVDIIFIIRIIIITIQTLMRGRQAAQSLPVLMANGQHVHAHANEATGITDADANDHGIVPSGEEGSELIPLFLLFLFLLMAR